jgi:hypothetical protein
MTIDTRLISALAATLATASLVTQAVPAAGGCAPAAKTISATADGRPIVLARMVVTASPW